MHTFLRVGKRWDDEPGPWSTSAVLHTEIHKWRESKKKKIIVDKLETDRKSRKKVISSV